MRRAFIFVSLAALMPLVADLFGGFTRPQETKYPRPAELPNPYRLVEGWPVLPKTMNGGQWGEVIRVHVDANENIWVFHRCFNIVPAGSATCIGRGPANPPILEFNSSGNLLKSFGAGLFAYRSFQAATPPMPERAIEEARLTREAIEHPELEAAAEPAEDVKT